MTEATVNLKLSPREFDLLRAELMARVTDLKYAQSAPESAKTRRERHEHRAEIELLLTKLNR